MFRGVKMRDKKKVEGLVGKLLAGMARQWIAATTKAVDGLMGRGCERQWRVVGEDSRDSL